MWREGEEFKDKERCGGGREAFRIKAIARNVEVEVREQAGNAKAALQRRSTHLALQGMADDWVMQTNTPTGDN